MCLSTAGKNSSGVKLSKQKKNGDIISRWCAVSIATGNLAVFFMFRYRHKKLRKTHRSILYELYG